MNKELWAITLCQPTQGNLENGVALIADYFARTYQDCQWQVLDLDATGKDGGRLTLELNAKKQLYLSSSELLSILQEDGQVIDLDAALWINRQPLFKIIIQDGTSVDVLGTGELPPQDVLGVYQTSDPRLFLWDEKR